MTNLPILVFTPQYKSVLWGGKRIATFKNIHLDDNSVGESWEISGVRGHESVVADGPYKGYKLPELIREFPVEILGNKIHDRYGVDFPLLIKFIDSADDLSVQVHPNDDLANKRHHCPGKTEMWISIDPLPNAYIYAGLNYALTPEDYCNRIHTNSIVNSLKKFYSKPGEVYFLPAGRVHSIGKGNFILEIQETSDITYRIYDFGRKDANGNTRQLHIEESMEAVNLNDIIDNSPIMVPSITNVESILVDCEHFTTTSINVKDEFSFDYTNRDSFTIIIVIDGHATITGDDNKEVILPQGSTVLIPANMAKLSIKGSCKLITTYIS